MSKRSRLVRWQALLGVLAALALPVAGWCQEDDDAAADEESAAEEAADEEEAEEAEDDDSDVWEQTYRGFYIQGQGSYAILTTENDAESEVESIAGISGANTTSDDSWGYGGRIGWRVMPFLALEGQVEIQNRFEFDHDTPGGEVQSDLRFLTATLNAKGYLPMERFQPYVLVGGGYANANVDPPATSDDNSHGGAARFGGGVDLYGTENVGVFTEVAYVLPFGDLDDYDHVSIGFGLVIRFYGE
jgi:hypothetical protein